MSTPFISAARLARMQAVATRTLDLTANTTRNSGSGTDALLVPLETWAAVLTNEPCAMAEPTQRDIQLYAGALLGNETFIKLWFQKTASILENDRVAVSGRTYRAQAVSPDDSYSTLNLVIAVQINEAVE